MNKIRKKNYSIDVCTVSYLRQYYSGVPNFLAFGTPHEGLFLMFGVPNAKYLAFGTPDESALIIRFSLSLCHFLHVFVLLQLLMIQNV